MSGWVGVLHIVNAQLVADDLYESLNELHEELPERDVVFGHHEASGSQLRMSGVGLEHRLQHDDDARLDGLRKVTSSRSFCAGQSK